MSDRFIRWGGQLIRTADGAIGRTNLYDLKDRLTAYWKFDENAESTTLVNSVGSGNLSVTGNVSTGVAGLVSNCIYCASLGQYLGNDTIPPIICPGDTYNWSTSFWINLDKDASSYQQQNIIYFNQGSVTSYVYIPKTGTWTNKIVVSLKDKLEQAAYANSSVISLNEWHHIVIVTSFDNNITIYRNNVDDTQGRFQRLTAPIKRGTTNLRIGVTGNPILGKIDELGFWNRRLTTEEITVLYNNGIGLTYPFSS